MADVNAKQYKSKDKPNATQRGVANDDEDAGGTSPRDQKQNEHKLEVSLKSDDNNNRKRPTDAKETNGVGKKPASVGELDTRRDGAARKQQDAWVVDNADDNRGVGDKKEPKKKEELKDRNSEKSDEPKHAAPAADPRGRQAIDASRGGQKKTPPDKFDEKVTTNGGERDAKQPDGKRLVEKEIGDKKQTDDGAVRRGDERPGRTTNGQETVRRTADDEKDAHRTKASPVIANGPGKAGATNRRVETERDGDEGGEYDDAEHDDGSPIRRNGPAVNGAPQHHVGGDGVRAPVAKKSDASPRQSNGAHQPLQPQQGQKKERAGGVKRLSSSDQMTGDEDDAVEEIDAKRRTFTGKSTLHHGASPTELTDGLDGGEPFESVNVVLRVRPLSNQETQRKDKTIFTFPGDGALWAEQPTGATKAFTYNMTFEPSASQEDVFENCGIKKLVEMAVNGYSCTAFAFGQTGSGKTYTITGPPDQETHGPLKNAEVKGLIPRSFYYLFYLMHKKPNAGYRLTASYLEIYNEQVIDLLNPNHRTYLPVRWSRHKGFYVENLFNVECETIEDLFAVLDEGLRNRATGSNSINEQSSRSHSVLTLHIDSEMFDEEDGKLCITKHGKLTFVDLAGSEKTKTDASTTQGHVLPPVGFFPTQGHVLESNNINRSLLVLGNCISALSDPKKRQGHVPYRDSKLTKLLADSLRGNAVTLMIACVSPSSGNSAESMNTLRYANRAKKVKSKPVIVMDPREKLIVSLKREIKILRQENHYLRTQLDFPVKPKGQLQKENDSKFLQMLKEQKRDGRVTEHGLYEMLQEYMIENEMLRSENTDLHQIRETGRREQQTLSRENEKLTKKLEVLLKGGNVRMTPVSYDTSSVRSIDSAASTPLQSPAGPRANRLPGSDEWKQNSVAPAVGRGKPVPVASKKPPHHLPNTVEKNAASNRAAAAGRSVDSLDVGGGNGTGAPGARRSLGNGFDDVDDDDEYEERLQRAKQPQPAAKNAQQESTRSGNDDPQKPYARNYTAEVEEMNRQLKQELLLIEREIQQQSTDRSDKSGGGPSQRFRRHQLPSDPQIAAVIR